MKTIIRSFSLILLLPVLSSQARAQGWREIRLPDVDATRNTIQFTDADNGWILSETAYTITKDGGRTWWPTSRRYPDNWRSAHDPYSGTIFGKAFSDSTRILVLQESGGWGAPTIYLSKDDSSWTPMYRFTHTYACRGVEIQPTRVFLNLEGFNDRRPQIFRVSLSNVQCDSTPIPRDHPSPGGWEFTDIAFQDSLNGYITASQGWAGGSPPWGLILKTVDGGRSWSDDTVMYDAGFRRTDFSKNRRGYISGATHYTEDPVRGTWSSVPTLRITSDGGKQWTYVWPLSVEQAQFITDSTLLFLTEDSTLKRAMISAGTAHSKVLFNKVPIISMSATDKEHMWLLAADRRTVYLWDPLMSAEVPESPMAATPTISQNYPNPARQAASVDITLPLRAHVGIALYDYLGRKVRSLAEGTFDRGNSTVYLDLRDVAHGIYRYRMTVVDETGQYTPLSKVMSVAK